MDPDLPRARAFLMASRYSQRTDLQFAFTEGIRDYMTEKIDYLRTQIGNPEGEESPNKKHYDPRVWLRKGEDTFSSRLKKAFEDLNNVNTL